MKKQTAFLLAALLLCSLCSCSGESQSARKILVKLRYESVNYDYSVYTPEYFGSEFSQCEIYDLYAGQALYVVLTVSGDCEEKTQDIVAALKKRTEVFQAQDCGAQSLANLTEYTSEKHSVKLCSRKYPYTDEFSGFEYDRQYRLCWYRLDPEYEEKLLSAEQREDWEDFYSENIGDYCKKEPSEAVALSFVKLFSIPKEDFDAVTQMLIDDSAPAGTGYDFDNYTENGELPNADIIYTFDNEIINNYYRYE